MPDEAAAWLPALAFAVSCEKDADVLPEFARQPLPEPLPPEALPWRAALIRSWERQLLALAQIAPPGTFPLATWAGRLSDQNDRCRLAAHLAIQIWLVDMAGGGQQIASGSEASGEWRVVRKRVANGEWRVEDHHSLLATHYSPLTTRHSPPEARFLLPVISSQRWEHPGAEPCTARNTRPE